MSKLQKTTCKLLEKTGYIFLGISKKIHQPMVEKAHSQWVLDQGDKTLRLNYDLNENAIVLDVGGYEGQWASDIYAKYNCIVHIFEPVKAFAQNIQNRFEKNKKIFVHDFGLGKTTTKTKITLADDASSTHTAGKKSETIKIVDIDTFVQQNNIAKIDLMKINIEGGEYELLERIIETNLIAKVTDIQVQFHDFVPNAQQKMKELQKKLSKTHKLTYHYPFIWENWTRRK